MPALCLALLLLAASNAPAEDPPAVTWTVEQLEDRIQGGLLGQILGNLNGLPHEFKYFKDPGDVPVYVPALPDGARTDDDTDIEWVYLLEIERSGDLRLPPDRIVPLWKDHINGAIWSANRYARQLMDLGLEPPLTGHRALNPWSNFNLAGQFECETFALAAPAMPQTAARLASHYTRVVVDGEPVQVTQLLASMIALAFVEDDVAALVRQGRQAVDPRSEVAGIVDFVVDQHRSHPDDWRATRRAIRDRYTLHGGTTPDNNGFRLNLAATLASLLHGRGDFAGTLRLAFAMGWDADNNAASCGAILGTIRGRRWLDAQGWTIADRYRNTTRPGLPEDETITRFGRRILAVALLQIREQGGEVIEGQVGAPTTVRVRRETPACVAPLPDRAQQHEALSAEFLPTLEPGLLSDDPHRRARSAYLALALSQAGRLQSAHPAAWSAALDDLKRLAPMLPQVIADAPTPDGDPLRASALAAGLALPAK